MKTILLIEDNIDILENLIEYLELEGFKVLATNNGKEGIVLAKEHLPDLIICDVLMHGMSGHEVLSLIHNTKSTTKIPFIISTSLSEKIDREATLKLGADDYIIKPYELEDLLKMANYWIKKDNNNLPLNAA